MIFFLVSFAVSLFLTLLVIKHALFHGPALDSDFQDVQKVHNHAVPRIGGLCIFLATMSSGILSIWRAPLVSAPILLLLLCSSVAFIGGIVEDYTGRVRPSVRLALTMLAAAVAYFLLGAQINRIDWIFSGWAFTTMWIALPLTMFAVAGIANAVNIIDGFNGLAGVVAICMLLSLSYVAWQVQDLFVLSMALVVVGAIAGFLVWNYPAGLIFLGDGGAYFIGFVLAELAVLLVMHHPQISTWYAALLLLYPAVETLFSVYRRVWVSGKPPGMPDGIHLHSLIFRRIVKRTADNDEARVLIRRNALTSPYLWVLSLMAVIPATLFWQHTGVLILFCVLFVISYVWFYARIVKFKVPRWMIRR